MKKALSLTLGLIFITASAFGAPASGELPTSHWAYQAISLLAKESIIDGYDANSKKAITRSEMAQIVLKAIANEGNANIAQRALIEKLANEFALDINNIDNKPVLELENRLDKVEKGQAKLEKSQSKLKISGLVQETYKMNVDKTGTQSYGQEKVRINFVGKVDDGVTANIRIASPSPRNDMFRDTTTMKYGEYDANSLRVDRMFAVSRIGITDISLGRQAMSIEPDDIIVDSDFFSYDGIDAKWKWNGYNFDIKRGRFASNLSTTIVSGANTNTNTAVPFNGFGYSMFTDVDIDAVMVSKENGNFSWNGGWSRFWNPKQNVTMMDYLISRVGYDFGNKFSMAAQYVKNTKAVSEGSYWMVSALYGDQNLDAKGKQNFSVQYTNVGKNTLYNNYSSSSFASPAAKFTGDAFWNLDLAYRYAFSPSYNIKFEYWNVVDKTRDVNQATYHYGKIVVGYKF